MTTVRGEKGGGGQRAAGQGRVAAGCRGSVQLGRAGLCSHAGCSAQGGQEGR